MAILTFPTELTLPYANEWHLKHATQVFASPLDGSVQTLVMPGAYWRCTVAWQTINATAWRALEAWLAELEGAGGRFYYGPQHAKTPTGAGGGTPLVNGASQVGSSLITDGWPVSTLVLKKGDYLQLDEGGRRRLHIVTANATSNASGQVTLSIKPPLRASPADNAALTINSPTTVMMLADDEQGNVAHRPAALASVSLAMREAI